jgi:predicted RNA methylase
MIADLGAGPGTLAEMLRARGLEVNGIESDAENQAVLRHPDLRVLTLKVCDT